MKSFLVLAMATSAASAQWTATILHNPALSQSAAYGVSGEQQVGYPGSLWTGSPGSRIDLTPAGYSGSVILAVHNGHQVGRAIGPQVRASLWSGTAASHISLHPPGALHSEAVGVWNDQQVGFAANSSGIPHACLWTGTVASFIDLHPAAASSSQCLGAGPGQQVGIASRHAALWTGTAASYVDLHPFGAGSWARATDGVQQVGEVDVSTGKDTIDNAALWSGSAASFISLHPPGASTSGALGVAGGEQVGYVSFNGNANERAVIWSGSAASYTDLHATLPPGYTRSRATAISKNAAVTSVVGIARFAGLDQAVLWTRYTCYANCDGSTATPTLTANDFQCFIDKYASNNPYANCDGSTATPSLTANDFQCFINKFAAGCT